jgi:Uma2 family endonuclease
MIEQIDQPYYTVEEYLWQEQRARHKNEYFDGAIYGMAGGSAEYSQIQSNLILEVGAALRGTACRILTSDFKVGMEDNPDSKGRSRRKRGKDFITYPDASLICGPLEYFREDRFTLANPLVLFEVLSPSTHNYDLTFKFEQYQKIASLKAYILIDSEKVWVRSCLRQAEQNRWIIEDPLEDLEDVLKLEMLNIEIPLRLLYERVEFDED